MQLYRLINKDKVVGYMKLEGGQIWHINRHPLVESVDAPCWVDIRKGCDLADYDCEWRGQYIPHDRIDQYTGIELKDEAKTKVFERDEATGFYEIDSEKGREVHWSGAIEWLDYRSAFVFTYYESIGKCCGHYENLESAIHILEGFKITGIQGVK